MELPSSSCSFSTKRLWNNGMALSADLRHLRGAPANAGVLFTDERYQLRAFTGSELVELFGRFLECREDRALRRCIGLAFRAYRQTSRATAGSGSGPAERLNAFLGGALRKAAR